MNKNKMNVLMMMLIFASHCYAQTSSAMLASCGLMNHAMRRTPPDEYLCNKGVPSEVKLIKDWNSVWDGQYVWSCTAGESVANCEASDLMSLLVEHSKIEKQRRQKPLSNTFGGY
jgi:hypothetical protein